MSIVSSEQLLKDAQLKGCAIGAFNVENMEMVQAVSQAAADENSPILVQTTFSTLNYASPAYFRAMVAAAASETGAQLVLHLDHGDSIETVKKCVDAGYSSVMIDGSQLSFEENVALTNKAVEYAHAHGVPVEAELGKVGGKEDDVESDEDNAYIDPAQAEEFVERSGCDSLAVGIGTAHGIYKGEPNIRLDILEEVRKRVSVPLVMHGTSGVADEIVKEAVKRGICKVNYATELRVAYTKAIREVLAADEELFDPKKYGTKAREYVKAHVCDKIRVCRGN